ncbi:MAG: hypothetical protein MR500_06675 [Erysipelotrichaceae bacterium]|nr:hypothetical protein [Erysipelotrichaceae bacterium]
MLNVIKYDILQNYRIYIIEYVVYLITCIILPFIPQNIVFIPMFLLLLLVWAMILLNFVTIFYNFYKSMYSNKGYLTMTLPLSSHELLLGKIFAGIIWIIISFVILFLGFGLIVLMFSIMENSVLEQLSFLLEALSQLVSTVYFYEGILAIIIFIISFITVGFTVLTIIQTKFTRKHKAIWAIVAYVALIVINNILRYAFVKIIAIFGLYNTIGNILQITGPILPTALISLIQSTILYFVSIYVLDNMLEM